MKKEDLKPGIGYSHRDTKELRPNKWEGRAKPVKRTWEQLESENKKKFKEIADRIRRLFPGSIVFAMNSRTLGNWNENSDFDILVFTEEENFTGIRKIIFDVKVDIQLRRMVGVLIP
jgi:predicted nucleotidyltransferase